LIEEINKKGECNQYQEDEYKYQNKTE